MDKTLESLFEAIRVSDAEQVRRLLKDGAAVNNKLDGYTPLMIAAGRGNESIVKQLLEYGADVNILSDAIGVSALHLAAQGGNVNTVELLVRHGAFVNLQAQSHGFTPLFNAVWHRQAKVVEYLLDLDHIDIEIISTVGVKARDWLSWLYNTEGLSKVAAEAQLTDAQSMERLFDAYEKRRKRQAESQVLLQLVLDAKITKGEKVEAVRRAIANGANVNAVYPITYSSNDGHTPLLAASRDGQTEIVKVLLENGADITARCGLMLANAAHKAASFGHTEILQLLAAHPDFPKIRDAQGVYNGYTPLMDAIWHGHTASARVLLESGARKDLVALDGLTAASMAQTFKFDDITDLLKQP